MKDTERTCNCSNGFDPPYCRKISCRKWPDACNAKGLYYLSTGDCVVKGGARTCNCHAGWGGANCNNESCNKITYCNTHGNKYFL